MSNNADTQEHRLRDHQLWTDALIAEPKVYLLNISREFEDLQVAPLLMGLIIKYHFSQPSLGVILQSWRVLKTRDKEVFKNVPGYLNWWKIDWVIWEIKKCFLPSALSLQSKIWVQKNGFREIFLRFKHSPLCLSFAGPEVFKHHIELSLISQYPIRYSNTFCSQQKCYKLDMQKWEICYFL